MYAHDKEYEEQQQGNNINSKENIGINSQVFFSLTFYCLVKYRYAFCYL